MFKLDVNYLDNLIKSSQKLEDPLKEITKIGLQSSCTIYVVEENKQWSGSGFHIGNGNIVTAAHVVPNTSPALQIKISFDNKSFYDAEVIVSEPAYDSAILYCKDIVNLIPALKLGNSDSLEVGDPVVVVSAPEGFHDTATYGRISNIHQSVKNIDSPAWNDIIFIDADILEGSSGGMVLGSDALVYGLIMGVTGSKADIGIGENSVCPSNKIAALLQQI